MEEKDKLALPWKNVEELTGVFDKNNSEVFRYSSARDCGGKEGQEVYEKQILPKIIYAVQAANSHSALVAACEESLKAFKELSKIYAGLRESEFKPVIEQLESALDEVRGEK